MTEYKTSGTYKGTRIIIDDAGERRKLINDMINIVTSYGFIEIFMPIIYLADVFKDKVGEENNNIMYRLTDLGERNLALAPEYTAVFQQLADEKFPIKSDKRERRYFYIGECFRGERPQAGRFREFTQFGVEIINPNSETDKQELLMEIAKKMIELKTKNYAVNDSAKRGLSYYTDGQGFEISCSELGAQSQICGGGAYKQGIGFAIGVCRLLLCK